MFLILFKVLVIFIKLYLQQNGKLKRSRLPAKNGTSSLRTSLSLQWWRLWRLQLESSRWWYVRRWWRWHG